MSDVHSLMNSVGASFRRSCLALGCGCLLVSTTVAAPPEGEAGKSLAPTTQPGVLVAQLTQKGQGASLTPAEQAFEAQLRDVVLTGYFTTDGEAQKTQPEKYQIVSAQRVNKTDWLIHARISYGNPNADKLPAIPIPVKVYWADDTPVLSLTNLTIPGMGTFTSRVMFFEGRYAGTWQHGEKGGHLFGTISKASPAEILRAEEPTTE